MDKQPLKVWHYTIPSTGMGEGWAYIMIREDGFFATVSDFGNYAYLWSHTGCDDVREFFLRAPQDWDYFAKKLKPEKVLNVDASFKRIREELAEWEKDGSLTGNQVGEAEDLIKEYEEDEDWEGLLRDPNTALYFERPWEFAMSDLQPDVVAFAKQTLTRLAKMIEAELAEERALRNAAGNGQSDEAPEASPA